MMNPKAIPVQNDGNHQKSHTEGCSCACGMLMIQNEMEKSCSVILVGRKLRQGAKWFIWHLKDPFVKENNGWM